MSSPPIDQPLAKKPLLEPGLQPVVAGAAIVLPVACLVLAIYRPAPNGMSVWNAIAISLAGASVLTGLSAAFAIHRGQIRYGLRRVVRTLFLFSLSPCAMSIDRHGYPGPEDAVRLVILIFSIVVAHVHLKEEAAG